MTTTTEPGALPRRGDPPEDVSNVDQDDLRLWGVTTLIGVLDKPALVGWAAKETALAAIHDQPIWTQLLERQGAGEAQRYLTGARYRAGKGQLSATSLGTTVHACCEEWVLTGQRPTKRWVMDLVVHEGDGNVTEPDHVTAEAQLVWQMLDHFGRWLDQFTPNYIASEVTVYKPPWYAGTCDGWLELDGIRFIFDIKTTRKTAADNNGKAAGPYPEAALQLAAYRYAEFAAVWRPRRVMEQRRRYYVVSASERELAVPVPEADRGLVIHITPDHCNAHPVRCDEEVFKRFQHVIEVAQWKFHMEQDVIGAPLTPPAREET